MPFYFSLIAAILPMILYLIFLWRLDKNERESFFSVFKHFLWGAFGAVFLGVLFSLLFATTIKIFTSNEQVLAFTGAVFIAPFVEESTKAIYLLFSSRNNYFDNITDGLVYGGAIGLGFGMTENLMYFVQYDETFIQWASLVFTRSVFSAVMHAIATATFGAFLAKSKFTISKNKYIYALIGLVLAMSFHLIWNLTLSLQFTFLIGIIFMIFLIISFFIIFKMSIKAEQKMMINELTDELEDFGFTENVSTVMERVIKHQPIFLEKNKNKKFLNYLTKLAFRKFQAKNSIGNQRENCLIDIENSRMKIKNLIS